MTIFTHDGWRGWFESMQSPAWDRTDALVFADWCRDWGEGAVEEYVRVECELDLGWKWKRLNPQLLDDAKPTHGCLICGALWVEWPVDGGWSLRSEDCGQCCDNTEMGEQIQELPPVTVGRLCRLAKLLADNPSWSSLPCPECEGDPKRQLRWHESGRLRRDCPLCDGTGNRLNGYPLTRWSYTPFVRAVGLRMEEIVREVECERCGGDGQIPKERGKGGWTTQGTMYRCPDCSGIGTPCRPTPLARALVAGLPTVRQLRVTDREPIQVEGGPEFGRWFIPWRDLPQPIADEMRKTASREYDCPFTRTFDSSEECVSHIAEAVYSWVAGFKPKEK